MARRLIRVGFPCPAMTLTNRLKSSFVAGLILVAPFALTLFILKIVVGWLLQFINPIVEGTRLASLVGDDLLAAQLLAGVLIVIALVILGYLTQIAVARHLFGNFGRAVNVIPLFSTIYGAIRQVANSLVNSSTSFESVVLVEYPRPGIYAIGFVTGDGPVAAENDAGEDVYNVYLPKSPNPTQGNLSLVPASDLIETEMSVRRGMRLLVTTGMGEEEEIDVASLPQLDESDDPDLVEHGEDDAV
mgnify:CR=1 FL=1